jgi:hypothetical protein
MTSRFAASGIGVFLLACAAGPPKPKAPALAAAQAAAPARTKETALPALTTEENELETRLRATVAHLSVEVGERNIGRSWNLATATDDLALALEKMGYEVRRQGVVVGDDVVQNLDVRVPGGAHGGQTFVVGAHFDTHEGSPGADNDASGVAAVLELARAFRDRKFDRSVRFAFFVNGEAPYFRTDHMGSLVYAKALTVEGTEVVGMLSIDGIGAFSLEPNSQRSPEGGVVHYPTTGDFVAVVGNEASRPLYELVTESLQKHTTMPVIGGMAAADLAFGAASDHSSFWTLGIPAVMITDTASLRYPHYHQKTDLPDRLDFGRMARVVVGLERAIEEIAQGTAIAAR